ncbi:unnamed protein product [Schistosoma mattheei]|uniref:Uncharacterized protein n=1 Tax=Schistosoma mattheei TaxID=31246 RepID=A0A183NIQ4_9TREM|nr:unnamed protein product [Schistosoma mattheei]
MEHLTKTSDKATSRWITNEPYDTTEGLAPESGSLKGAVRNKEVISTTEDRDQCNRWIEHFEELLKRPATLDPLDIEAAHTVLIMDVTRDHRSHETNEYWKSGSWTRQYTS